MRASLLLAVAVILAPQALTKSIYDRPINDALRLRVTAEYQERTATIDISLVDLNDASLTWRIAGIDEEYPAEYTTERADDHSYVFSRHNSDYGFYEGSTKLFFDPVAKRLLKRIDYTSDHDLDFGDDAAAALLLGVPRKAVSDLRSRGVFLGRKERATESGDSVHEFSFQIDLPEMFVRHPLPPTTFEEFARARPHRVADGYSKQNTEIKESIAAYDVEGDQTWFAKAFYDGEGLSGVGGIGFVDRRGHYEFLRIPQMIEWSASALLVERNSILVGRVIHPEGEDHSGGLMQYDRRSHRVSIVDLPDVVHSIARADGALFLGTNNGLYVLRNGKRTRFRAEPDIDGRFVVVSELF